MRVRFIVFTMVIALVSPNRLLGDSTDIARWKHYVRGGLVGAESNTGSVGYYRLNRRTERTFRDIRFFAYELDRNSYLYLRYKSSNRYNKIRYLYSFTTLALQRNTRANLAVRYHYNQGLGIFLLNYKTGLINAELAHAFDMSDYLNNTRKTSYLKSSIYWDHDGALFSTKLELEYFYQISEVVQNNLTRNQLMAELIVPLMNNLSLIAGYETEVYPGKNKKDAESYYLVLGWKKLLSWTM